MKLTDQKLRELLAGSAAGDAPDAELLRRAVRGELSDEEREQLIDALIENPASVEDYRIVRALERGAARAPAAIGRTPLALAAILVLGIGAGLYLGLRPAPSQVDSLRGSSGVQPADGAVLRVPPPRLDWPDVVGALRYQVLIRDAGGEELWRSPWVPASEVALPPPVLALLQGGGVFSWTAAVDADEDRLLATPHRFSVEP